VALLVLTNASIVLGGNDISDHCSKVAFEAEVEELDATTFSSTGWSSMLGGLKKGNLGIGLKGDFAAGSIDSILWPLLGTVAAFVIKANNAAVSTSNPTYSGSVLISKLTPITGEVGKLVEFDHQWPTTGAVTRATS
jgi:hypothetical protein